MRPQPIFSVVCPCCASTLVVLARANGHRLAPLVWTCAYCGFTLMGLAVPIARTPEGCQYTCLDVLDMTTPILGSYSGSHESYFRHLRCQSCGEDSATLNRWGFCLECVDAYGEHCSRKGAPQ